MKKFISLLLFLSLLGIETALAQTRQVTGTVTSAEDGLPIIGASVIVEGTTIGTVTDIDGKYTLNVPANAKTLRVTYVGMETQDQTVQSVVNFAMQTAQHALEEVVVTALGIKRSEKAIGFAASSVSAEELTSSRSTDIMSGLSGKIAGVQISSASGDPGASNSVIIRGISSLNGSNQPLYVIDGVPMTNTSASSSGLGDTYDFGNSANMVNPNDVENMSILKGAAATALYGSRAANGVILITTKTGGKQRGAGLEYNGGVQIANVLRLPEFQNDYGIGWSGTHTLIENGSWGPKFDGSMELWGTVYNNSQKVKPYVAMEDNIQDFFDTGVRYSNSLSYSGGNENTDYYLSLSQTSDDGMLPTSADTYDRYTFSGRGSHKFKDLTISSSVNYAEQRNNFAQAGQGLSMINSIYQTPRDVSLVSMEDLNDPFNTLDYYYTPYGVGNPYWILQNYKNTYKQNRTYGKVEFDYKFLDMFNIIYRLGIDNTNSEMKRGVPEIVSTPGTPNYGQIDQVGEIYEQRNTLREINHDLFLTYDDQFDKLHLNALVGMNINERKSSTLVGEGTSLSIPTWYDLSNAANTESSEAFQRRRLVGVFGQVELGWDNMIFITGTARNDWSSTLPKGNRDFFYPGVTGSFVFSELLKGKAKDIISFGKVRIAWGQTGNDADPYQINPYYTQTVLSNNFQDLTFPFGGINAFTYGNTLGSLSLNPEITTEFELGANVSLFNGRISVDASYYNRNSNKQIFPLNMDPATGFTSQVTNLGKIRNRGIELLVTLRPIEIKDFTWDLSWNFTKNNSKVISLPEELGGSAELFGLQGGISMYAVEGMPMGVFKSEVVEKDPSGNIVVNASTGLPEPASEYEYVGDINYDYEMGISNKFKYKGITLGVDIDIRQGGVMYSRTKNINYFVGNAIQTTYNDRNPFIVPNSVNKLADGTYVQNTTPISVSNQGTFWDNGALDRESSDLIDKSYVKLRQITLGWDLPRKWLRNTFLQDVNVSIYGTNLFVWTPDDNTFIDPEMTSFGNDLYSKFGEFSANPTSRKFGFNLNVKF